MPAPSAAQKQCVASDVHRGSVATGPAPRLADTTVGQMPDW